MKIWSSINLPWGHARSHTKFGPDRFSRFDVYWIQTDKQTPKQTDKPNLYIDVHCTAAFMLLRLSYHNSHINYSLTLINIFFIGIYIRNIFFSVYSSVCVFFICIECKQIEQCTTIQTTFNGIEYLPQTQIF